MKLFFNPFIPYFVIRTGTVFKKSHFSVAVFVNLSLSVPAKLICFENSVLAQDRVIWKYTMEQTVKLRGARAPQILNMPPFETELLNM